MCRVGCKNLTYLLGFSPYSDILFLAVVKFFPFAVLSDPGVRRRKQSIRVPERLRWFLHGTNLDGSHYNVGDVGHHAAWYRDATQHQYNGSL